MNDPAPKSQQRRYKVPDNEFSEICTGDMRDMDLMYHHWMQDRWNKEREAYNKRHGIFTEGKQNAT